MEKRCSNCELAEKNALEERMEKEKLQLQLNAAMGKISQLEGRQSENEIISKAQANINKIYVFST